MCRVGGRCARCVGVCREKMEGPPTIKGHHVSFVSGGTYTRCRVCTGRMRGPPTRVRVRVSVSGYVVSVEWVKGSKELGLTCSNFQVCTHSYGIIFFSISLILSICVYFNNILV